MFDVITFGSATSDTFLKLKEGVAVFDRRYLDLGWEICFPLGTKIKVNDIKVFSGGGGVNSAFTFANLGFKTAYVGKVGDDIAGITILEDLRRILEKSFKPFISFLKKDIEHPTAASIILAAPGGERTVLVYRGACHFMTEQDIPWPKIQKSKWFYLAPLSEQSADLFWPLVKFAKENKIKVAVNPGDSQIKMPKKVLQTILSQVDVLLLNLEEASLLTGISQKEEKKIIKRLADFCPGILAITKGEEGALVFDGKRLFQADIFPVKIEERTGAGDAFGSGLVAGLLKENNVEYAIRLATVNSGCCVRKIGAKNGLLTKKDLIDLPEVKIREINL